MSQDSPAHVPDGQPNPVLIGPGLKALRDKAYTDATNATPSLDADRQHPTDSDVPSYFANIPGAKTGSLDPSEVTSMPSDTGRQPSSGQDLLRRLSLTEEASPMSPGVDPRAQHPGLKLSGRLISAAFCIPYKLYFQSESDWVCDSIHPLCRGWLTDPVSGRIDAEAALGHFGALRFICSLGIRRDSMVTHPGGLDW